MGCWGMGIDESDEYLNVYDEFMDAYNEGLAPADIQKKILDDYLSEFEEDDGILHDVYFAIGRAEWMCGGVSDEVMEKITAIIESGANIDFYRELEADEKSLKERKKNLDRFLNGLKKPPKKPKKRPALQKKPLNPWTELKQGDVYAYRDGKCFRVFALLNREHFLLVETIGCYAFQKKFREIPALDDLAHENVMPLGSFSSPTFPDGAKLTRIGHLSQFDTLSGIDPSRITDSWKPATLSVVKEVNLTEDYPDRLCLPLEKAVSLAGRIHEQAEADGVTTSFFDSAKEKFNDIQFTARLLPELIRNEIVISAEKAPVPAGGSHFGGNPDVPDGFVWPTYQGESPDGVEAERPLTFLAQFRLADVAPYDTGHQLPSDGTLSFFYEAESQRWGFDPDDDGCARVYYFEDGTELHPMPYPGTVPEEYDIPVMALSFETRHSCPDFYEITCHAGKKLNMDYDEYDRLLAKLGYAPEDDGDDGDEYGHKLLGYADLIQDEMLTECETVSRMFSRGDSGSIRKIPEDIRNDIHAHAKDWVLLFQMASIEDGETEILWGDCGCLYFYIRKEDLAQHDFSQIHLSLQCG